ncbi:MAG: primosomal protein DnaI [Bacillota bacterium]
MKKIDDYLKKLDKKVDYDALIDKFMENPIINKFILDNDLKHTEIIRGINPLLIFYEENSICNQCPALKECKLQTTGYNSRLVYNNEKIDLEYKPCRYNKLDYVTSNIDALYVPKRIFEATLDDFDLIGDSRKSIHKYVLDFLKKFNKDNFMKGIYLSGKYGTGKTYILAVIANELAKLNYKVIFAYYPDLVRELKSSISKGNLEEKILKLKQADILFLDDIGGEFFSRFIRDEVMGPILQHRLLDKLPTFFSSNLNINELSKVMRESESSLEAINSIRIIQRIKRMTEEFALKDIPHLS